jgi:tripartite-type tricarboxylate transporter receptor subunit TctC
MMNTVFDRRAALAGGLGLLLAPTRPFAQGELPWPDRPVRLVNSGAPGSGIDLLARLLADGFSQRLGQAFPVDNRPGAGSVLAAQTHAAARAGESLLLGATGMASTVPYTFNGRLPYDPDSDLVPIAIAGSEFLCLVTHADLPAADLGALIRLMQARSGELNWNSVPGYAELDMRLFLNRRGLQASFVGFRGSPPAVLDLAAGRLHFAILPLTPLLGSIREGKIRPLAVTSSQRAPALPNVPTIAEAGFEELRYDPFTGLFGWKGMPENQRNSLASLVAAILNEPATADRLQQAGIVARHGSGTELAEMIEAQRRKVREAVRVVGVQPG